MLLEEMFLRKGVFMAGFHPPPKVVEFIEPGKDRARKRAGQLHVSKECSFFL